MSDITPEYTPTSQLSVDAKRKKIAVMKAELADLNVSIAIAEAELGDQVALVDIAPLP